MTKIAILVSGSGSNMMAVIEAVEARALDARVVVVISSNSGAGALIKAKAHGIETVVCALEDTPPDITKLHLRREARDGMIVSKLNETGAELVVLAGYLGILTPELINTYEGRIINIHPSLLPKHGGVGMYGINVHKSVIEAGDEVSGATVHYVVDDVDGGEIILQRECEVLPSDTPEILQQRVLNTVEHSLLVDAIRLVLDKKQIVSSQ